MVLKISRIMGSVVAAMIWDRASVIRCKINDEPVIEHRRALGEVACLYERNAERLDRLMFGDDAWGPKEEE